MSHGAKNESAGSKHWKLISQTFSLYSSVFLGPTAKRQRALRKIVLEDKAELAKTSSQDEFAKWAKLRRKVDKSLADLEKISEWFGGRGSG